MSVFIGVPWKGRNFRKAASDLLDDTYYDPEYLADLFNGRSKRQAKSEDLDPEFVELASRTGIAEASEFQDTGRNNPRLVFDSLETDDAVLDGYGTSPFETGYDVVYAPDDLAAESVIDESVPEDDLVDLVDERVDYEPAYAVGDPVSLAALESGDEPIEKVLVPEDLEQVSRSLAGRRWGDVGYDLFSDYSGEEEQVVADTPDNVAGVYIVDSGSTAESYGLDYERMASTSLRRWERE